LKKDGDRTVKDVDGIRIRLHDCTYQLDFIYNARKKWLPQRANSRAGCVAYDRIVIEWQRSGYVALARPVTGAEVISGVYWRDLEEKVRSFLLTVRHEITSEFMTCNLLSSMVGSSLPILALCRAGSICVTRQFDQKLRLALALQVE
jgi:hypothetical protein